MKGLIIKGIGGFYYVKTNNATIECKARGRFRNDNIKPFVGDYVEIEISQDNTGRILEILERKNLFIRPPIANIDRIFIVVAQRDPAPDFLFIDKIAAICSLKNIEPIIVINKTDLDDSDFISDLYKSAGFVVLKISTLNKDVKDIITPFIKDKICAFVGLSGVGKSSIINKLDLLVKMEVGDISEKIMRGKHTTRHVELIENQGGFVADTPGFSLLDIEKIENINKDQIQYGFIEFEKYIGNCKFSDCSHLNPVGCEIFAALKSGKINQSRYNSYVNLYEQIKNKKEWEN